MTSWQQADFAEVIKSRGSGTAGLPQSEWAPQGKYPVIGQGAEYVEGWTDRDDLLVRPNPALVLYGGHTRRAKFVNRPFVPGPNVKILEPAPELDAAFLFRYLEQLNIESRGYADHFPEVRRRRVPVPPLTEQRRIAEILDKADVLRAKRRAALSQLDALHQSIFLDMFGDAATNPKGWEVSRLDDISECLDRLRRPITESDRKPGDVPYYGANGQQGWIDKALFDEPLILVAEDGGYFDEPERGVAYRIDGPAWVNNHAHILRAIPARVDTEFLHRALRHFNFMPFISGTTRAKLTQGQLNAVKLFVPPLDLQREFGARVERLRRVLDLAARAAGQIDALFSALQHQAFRGDLARDASGAAPA